VGAVAALVLLAMAACGAVRDESGSPKPDFVLAADRICDAHLKNMLSWLEQRHGGQQWLRLAVQHEGTYGIIAHTIHRLESLGLAPGPNANAFAGYVKTLKARAALYRLASMAEVLRDSPFARRLQQRLEQVDALGDGYARRYGLRICGASLRDLAQKMAAMQWATDSRSTSRLA
jgi:hypothetical protein